MKIKRVQKAEELSIGQMYMYKDCGRYKRGYCMAILKDRAVFESCFGLSDTLFYKRSWDPFEVYYYNASIYNKYKKLCEQHKKEIEDLFNNKEVIVKSISDKKWYERFLRRK